jgi:RNA polymerase-associated protein
MIQLYSDSRCPFSHRVRIVLNEKEMDFKIIDVNINSRQDLMQLNPYNETPVLLDDIDKNNKKRDLVLLDTNIVIEYIDERFPHPQLMPIEPAEKARMRMAIHKLDRELFQHVRYLENNFSSKDAKIRKELERVRKVIAVSLDEISNVFALNKKMDYFASSTFTLLDASLLPILWRLSYYEIEVKKTWNNMMKYAETQFNRPSFLASLTAAERSMKQ